jgi:aspartyl/asparaginyl-tRNA synthetase
MDDSTLFKSSISFAVIGLIILFFISEKIEIDEAAIDRLDEIEIGTTVKIKGHVEDVQNLEKVAFLKIAQEKIETVSVVLFKEENISLNKGDYIEVVGEIEDYEGKKEIIGNLVKRI